MSYLRFTFERLGKGRYEIIDNERVDIGGQVRHPLSREYGVLEIVAMLNHMAKTIERDDMPVEVHFDD